MKKLLILIAAIVLVSCGKDEDLTLSRAEQEIENAKLVGTWESRYNQGHTNTFTDTFEIIQANTEGETYNCTYTLGRGMIMLGDCDSPDSGRIFYYTIIDGKLYLAHPKNLLEGVINEGLWWSKI